jgi:rubrerythrin
MDTQFSVFEILQIAEEVELKTARFCLRAAERFTDRERRGLYYSLAESRAKQRTMWRRLRRQYSEKTGEFGIFDPDNYVRSNPWTMAGLTGYGTDPNGQGRPSGSETKEQILHDAVRRSQGIIIFYHGLKDFARGPDSRLMIDNIISQEERYIRLLKQALERMQAPAEEDDRPAPACCANLEDNS